MLSGWLLNVNFVDSLSEKRILVFGAGVTGTSVKRFMDSRGANTFLIDENEKLENVTKFEKVKLAEIDLGIVSPGWKLDHQFISESKAAGIELISEIDLAWRVKSELNSSQVWLGLTGTNGKTTTVQMAEAMLLESGIRARACGNVGEPVIDMATDVDLDILVLELSSFQLSWSREAHFKASGILNIADDHIDWHGSFDKYADAKISISTLSETLIANLDDEALASRIGKVTSRLVTYTLATPKPHQIGLVENLIVDRAFVSGDAEVLFELSEIKPAVPHNVSNAMAAAALARSVGAEATSIARAISAFRLDHHRLEIVLEKNGITWIDDSKATNPHAALAALKSQVRSVWIAGGLAKGAAMDQLIKETANRIKFAILIGADAQIIEDALRRHAPLVEYQVIDRTLKGKELMLEVVRVALAKALPGETVLLAPACASMDQFKNYGERGNLFASAVKELVNGK
jgi:UDP-N-acetylmuramoylalanine--D-glutamate ligase